MSGSGASSRSAEVDGQARAAGPPPGARAAAVRAEQAHLDRVHTRVESLRERAASRVADASADRSGSTFQARFERDVVAHHHANRQQRFTFGDVESLVFGRIDVAGDDPMHVGRLSVVDGDGEVILVDWRAPASAPFYQATVATPLGVARRRTLVTRGREVRDLDDEILDAQAADAAGLVAVSGQGALLAALSQHRTGRMRDIVATIQADQDAIIRAPATGTLVVTGGPGTGKTVVALHRVASLLYRDRDRFEGRGVLVIGPSQAFTEYTARVLPALGEDRAVQRPLAGLAPRGTRVRGHDDLEVARVKGDLRMVEVARGLLAASLPPIPPDVRVSFEGTTVSVPARQIEQVRARQLDKLAIDEDGASYRERREAAADSLVSALWRRWARAHRAAGARVPDGPAGSGFPSALDASPSMTMLWRCYWPDRDPVQVLAQVVERPDALRALLTRVLGPEDGALLADAWVTATGPTHDDVALLDELDALIGRDPRVASRPADDGGLTVTAHQLRADAATTDVGADDYRDFAHVVVDEAQDLTPMQWRAVARRGPYASWTVVGDLAQRSRVAEPATWQDIARLIGRREVHVRSLRVNYRTPTEIAEVAAAVLAAAGHDPSEAPEAIRATGERPRLVVTEPDLTTALRQVVAALLAEQDGTIAVIAEDARCPEVAALLAPLEADVDAVGRRTRVLDPRTAKGLEFDDVVVVAPEEIVAASAVGPHQLYVAVTRATRRLVVVTDADAQFPGREHLDIT